TVTSILFVDVAGANTITHTVGGSARLNVSDGATVYYNDGKFDVAPTYAGKINLHSFMKTGATRAIHATVWPATAGLVNEFNLHNNALFAGNSTNLPGGRQVNTQLTLTSGNLNLAAGAQVLTLADNLLVKVVDGTVTLGGGSIVYGNNLNYSYEITAPYVTAAELASSVKDITFTRTGNVVNAAVTLNKTVTVNGTLTIRNDLTIPAAPPTIVVTALGDVNIALDAAYTNATIPVTNFNQSLVFGGANNATINVPAATPALNIGAITINKTNNTNTVTLAGGNLTTGTITFVNGLIVTGSNILFIPAPTTFLVAGGAVSQGFTRAGVTGNNISHVVGNVGKTLVNTGGINTSTEARSVFPVGTTTVYRPAAVNFNPAFGVPTNPNATIVVSHVDSNPTGAAGLPIKDGVAQGIDVARYPNFYWYIYSTPNSVGPTTLFDLELTGGNFTDFDDPANVRIIRRHGAVGDINNAWLLQGANDAYDNEVNSITGFTAVNRGANAGLRSGGAVFTFGIKSNMSINPASALAKYINTYKKIWLVLSGGVKSWDVNDLFTGNVGTLSFSAQSSNPAVVTTSIITGSKVQLTPVALGDAVVTVKANDAANNDSYTYSFEVNVGPTDVKVEEGVPTAFSLSQNYPNPFNPSTTIKFGLPKESNVSLKIYNILGEEVATLANEVMQAGFHTVNFDASRLASGMYIYRIQAGNFTEVKKMLLMK
ncbi:MAG: T9SS type A sorting domain-containing protein, partial [Bacteroidota bacterium]